MSDLKSKSINAFTWDFGGQFAKIGISFFISIFLARLLSPSDFGMLAMVNVFIVMSYAFMDIGLGNSLIQRKDLQEIHYSSVLYFNIILGVLLAITLFSLAGSIATFYKQPLLKNISKALSVNFIINSFTIVQNSKLTKSLDFRTLTKARLLAGMISGMIAVIMALLGLGVWSLVLQAILSNLLYTVFIWSRAEWYPKLLFKFSAIKDLWGYGFRMFVAGSLDNLISNADSIVIGKFFNSSTLGQFYRAKSFQSLFIQYASGSLIKIYFPVLSKLQDQKEKFLSVVVKTFHLLNFIVFFVLGLLFLGANDLIILLFGVKWTPAILYFRLLLVGSFTPAVGSLIGIIPSSLGNSKVHLKMYIIGNVFVILNLFICVFYGIQGYLGGLIFVNIICMVINIYFSSKTLNISYKIFTFILIKYLSICVILCLLITLMNQYLPSIYLPVHLIILSLVFSISYILICKLINLDGLIIARAELRNSYNKYFKR